jgi:ketosteroid isomerase-like protein
MRSIARSAFALIVFATGCTTPPPAPPPIPDLAAAEAAIRAADAGWLKAAQARDSAAEAAMFAADGVAYRAHLEPMVGPAAFQAYAEKDKVENPKATINWTTDRIEVAASGDLAIQISSVTIKGLGPKGDGEDRLRFVTVWKLVNGEWKVAHDIGSTTMPDTTKK